MNNRIKETFEQIHAEETLKEHTMEYLVQKTQNYKKPYHTAAYKKLIPAIACFVLLLIGFSGYWLYFTQTSVISIDINPSIELSVNRFNQVISIHEYNDDGLELKSTLDIQFMNYKSALNKIVGGEQITAYLNQDEVLSISVVGRTEDESRKMLEAVKTCVPEQKNICCEMSSYDEISAAHAAGLSVGKYRAFLELQKVNPKITADDIKGLSMRQIRDLINSSARGKHHAENGKGHNHSKRKKHSY